MAYSDYTKNSFEDTRSFVEKLSGVSIALLRTRPRFLLQQWGEFDVTFRRPFREGRAR